ncbi:hypothetical protein E1B28_009926 [Marasmius oreades]|uniref:Uncharacterized protein n=1 Tax=Marasmius oreades TaxID=181124 RepID=A0A9P7UT51_9AGAR|nr:uncharacterized protein E1B28_009926 [Marasmius oreades]KAG7090844.1 hypothetical protein E1B28_009926 [Marasmius oreades]
MSSSSLNACIARLDAGTRSICSITRSINRVLPGPFTHALLFTKLGDLIRDIDPSELGLFSVSNISSAPPPQEKDVVRAPSTLEISRVEFHGATPLRKPQLRKEGQYKPKELLPEVYARAALKCIERYQQVRPMSSAHSQASAILEQLEAVRERIKALIETLKETETAEAPSLAPSVEEEEQSIQVLRLRIADHEKRRNLKNGTKLSPETHKPPSRKIWLPNKIPATDLDEDTFWTASSSSTRTPRFSDNLLDEVAEFGEQSILSLASPAPLPALPSPSLDDSKEEEILRKPSPAVRSPLLDHVSEMTMEVEANNQQHPSSTEGADKPIPPSAGELEATPTQTPGPKKPKIRINMEIERTVAKIWACNALGDITLPRRSSAIEAKSTIAHLQSLSSMALSPSSPTTSASSAAGEVPSQPSPHQILTAHLLLALLTSPQLSLPLNKVKELLSTKASTSGSIALASNHMKPYFTCLSKRLLKVDRASGEQLVKFNL